MIKAKKKRRSIEWERLEISSRKLEITKGTFHAKMGTIKDKNGMDLTEAKDIKKRWHVPSIPAFWRIFIINGC